MPEQELAMIRPTLETLTWCTIGAAVVSALLLSATEDALPDSARLLCANVMLNRGAPVERDSGDEAAPVAPTHSPTSPASHPDAHEQVAAPSRPIG